MDYPVNWDQCESEHNKHYDPYEETCELCSDLGLNYCECEDE